MTRRGAVATEIDLLASPRTKKQNNSLHGSESSIKTEILQRKLGFDEEQLGKGAPDLSLHKMRVEDAKRKGYHSRLRCFSSELPNGMETRGSTAGDEESAGGPPSQRTLLLGQDAFNPGRQATVQNRLRTSR